MRGCRYRARCVPFFCSRGIPLCPICRGGFVGRLAFLLSTAFCMAIINVTNNGTVSFDGGGVTCGDSDSILIRSSVGATQRTWSGTGVFDFTDVDLQDQAAALALIAVSSTDSG